MTNLKCPTCSQTRVVKFDHIAKLVTIRCPRCDHWKRP